MKNHVKLRCCISNYCKKKCVFNPTNPSLSEAITVIVFEQHKWDALTCVCSFNDVRSQPIGMHSPMLHIFSHSTVKVLGMQISVCLLQYLKYLNSYQVNCHHILCRHSFSPEDISSWLPPSLDISAAANVYSFE